MNLKRYVVLAAAFALVSVAKAETSASAGQMHEILLGAGNGTNASLQFGGSTIISVNAGYNYTMAPGWQIGILGNILNTNATGTSVTTWGARAQLTANFPMESDLKDAIFFYVNFGLQSASVLGVSSTNAILGAGLGKRFEIVSNVSWRPNFGIDKSFASGSDIQFVVNVVEISALF